MKSATELSDRFTEVILSGTWIANTNYRDQLLSINWQTATGKVGSLNSIAVLAQHIHYYIGGINSVLKGGNLEISDRFSFDFAPILNEVQWQDFLSRFWADAEEFTSLVQLIPDNMLNEPFTDPKYGTLSRNIDGMIEHSYYHLGQIVLIRKLLERQYC